ncbi:glycosyl hydrolase family 3 N terminal domain-containing protein [Dactylonectria macrodidyma]|uniref:Probable beta-glucosidase G n=1 Tax=Dactylonectria macrodidyma TaxID=307937 RepID=A0A9P9IZL5_9HYPO|nr:glycosyl hydrolase family 3 N terminal domain-containing protein [Dactylonectria macrodidyma]
MANDFISRLNLSKKSNIITGKLQLGLGGCIRNILPIECIGFPGVCFQDGPNGVNIADLTKFRAKGIEVALGPSAGPISRHGLRGRNWEGFSIDPYLSGIAMDATIRGIQSQGVQACAKYINGTRIKAISSNISNRTLHELYLWPFSNTIKARAVSTICSYNRLNQTYACKNPALLKGLLREQLGFRGYIISDWFITHSGSKSINTRLNMNMPKGSITKKRINKIVYRIISPYFYFGQDQNNFPTIDLSLSYTFRAWSNVLSLLPGPIPKSRNVRANYAKLIRKIGAKVTVLLKNVNSTLPLKAPLNIGVFNNDTTNPSNGLTFIKLFEVGTLDISGSAANDFLSIYPILDVCINSTLVVTNIANKCLKTVIVTHSASINSIAWANNTKVSAILAAHLPGQESGHTIANLPYSIAKNPEDYNIPIVNLTKAEVTSLTAWQAEFTEGQMIDYKHFDAASIKPLFEFGFGLSYTRFTINSKPDASLTIQPGDSMPKGTLVQVLRGFEKSQLKPGESRDVEFTLLRRDISYWDTVSQQWVVPKGKIGLRAGFSSRDIKAKADLNLKLTS